MRKWRFYFLFAVPAIALLVLGGRVVHLQVCRGGQLSELARRQQRRVIILPARHGNIFARTRTGHTLLAGSRRASSVYADPVLLGSERFAATAAKLAAVLGCTDGELYDKLFRRRDKRFVYMVRDVTDSQAEAVRNLKIRAIGVMGEWRRNYPGGSLAGQVLGFRLIDGRPGGGIELQADKWLSSRDGRKVVRCDASRRGSYADVEEYDPPQDGKNVVLTLDVSIQGFLEDALSETAGRYGAEAAMGVVMDPNTGAILAIASLPSFDPNRYSITPPEHRRCRAITDPYEPGSVFKPFIVAGAVQMGKVTLDTTFYCHNGLYRAHRGGTIRDFPGCRFGRIPLSEIVIKSSNIGMSKLGEHLGNESLCRIASAFGFGVRSGIDLSGECPGRLVNPRRWTGYATRRMPFGQGPIMVTTVQLANAFSAIANGGELLRPRLIERVTDVNGKVLFENRRRRIRQVLSAEVSRRFIDEVLVNVVERGTGKRCRMDRWSVFGKTGTAQIGGPDGYEEHAYTATFMAGAPASKPAVVCVISIYKPEYGRGYTGGKVAAPCVRRVLQKTLPYLDIPPDKNLVVSSR